jgi:hypothetical protein
MAGPTGSPRIVLLSESASFPTLDYDYVLLLMCARVQSLLSSLASAVPVGQRAEVNISLIRQ